MSRWIGVSLALVMGLGAQACGSGTDLNGGSDDDRRRPTTTVVDDEEKLFELVEMTPEVESHLATPLSVVTLTYNLDVDPETLDGVVVRERGSERTVPARVEVDGPKITVTPLRPLGEKAFYTVDALGVRSLEPNTNPVDHSGRFFTQTNFVDLYLRYQDGVANRAHDFSWNAEARELLIVHYGPGNDGVVLTPDDVQDIRAISRFDENLDETWSDTRGPSGEDGLYDTDDDSRLYLREIVWGPQGELSRTYTFYGADQLAGTDDDYKDVSELTYGEGDRVARSCGETACTGYRYGASERIDVQIVDPGPDGTWQTDDDLLGPEYTHVVYDERGLEITVAKYEMGAEGTPRPAEDVILRYSRYERDEHGLVSEVLGFDGPGLDGVWMTPDDRGSSRTIIGHDEDGFTTTRFLYHPGVDAIFGTEDDTIQSSFFYEANQD